MPTVFVDPRHPDPGIIADAAERLHRGGLVAFPTETVYGLGADGLSAKSVARIYWAKERPAKNPLIQHVADIDAARAIVTAWPATAQALADAFWPGPLTMVLPKQSIVPDESTAGRNAVGVRIPSHPVALALLRAFGGPIAAPSANRYTELSPTSAEHVARSLGERVDLILDGGPTSVGIESTVVDLTGSLPRILRPGTIAPERIAAVVGELDTSPIVVGKSEGHLSPGLSDRHYAPRATLVLLDANDTDAIARAATRLSSERTRGGTIGIISFGALQLTGDVAVAFPRDPDACAHRLYATLHDLDEEGCTMLFVEAPPEGDAWNGVRDRLRRASAAF
jgi:L-threonylcarbamoyladenylate synthase